MSLVTGILGFIATMYVLILLFGEFEFGELIVISIMAFIMVLIILIFGYIGIIV